LPAGQFCACTGGRIKGFVCIQIVVATHRDDRLDDCSFVY
jgi:hypothetical protein